MSSDYSLTTYSASVPNTAFRKARLVEDNRTVFVMQSPYHGDWWFAVVPRKDQVDAAGNLLPKQFLSVWEIDPESFVILEAKHVAH